MEPYRENTGVGFVMGFEGPFKGLDEFVGLLHDGGLQKYLIIIPKA